MRAVVLAVVVLLSYPGVSLVLARVGVIEMPGTPLELLSPASSTQQASARASWQWEDGTSRRALRNDDELSHLGAAVAGVAAERLSVSVAEWDFKVLRSGIGFPPRPTMIIARERNCGSSAGRRCVGSERGLTVWISVGSMSVGSAVVQVFWQRGPSHRSEGGLTMQVTREGGQWVAVPAGDAQ